MWWLVELVLVGSYFYLWIGRRWVNVVGYFYVLVEGLCYVVWIWCSCLFYCRCCGFFWYLCRLLLRMIYLEIEFGLKSVLMYWFMLKSVMLFFFLFRLMYFIGKLNFWWIGIVMLFLVVLLSLVSIILVYLVVLENFLVWLIVFWLVVVFSMSSILWGVLGIIFL